ncbi:MAG: metallophosphoesterase [Alloprevotella sp.]
MPTLLTAITLLLFVAGRSSICMQAFFILLTCFFIPKVIFLLFDVLSLLAAWLLRKKWKRRLYLPIALALLVFAAQVFGVAFGTHILKKNEIEIPVKNLPAAFDGYRIIQISDLHLGTYNGHTGFVEKVVRRINEERADLIVFTGDLVNVNSTEVHPYADILAQLKASDGVVAVLGNHDYCIYNAGQSELEKKYHFSQIIAFEKECGWQVLRNEHLAVSRNGQRLYIAGVENNGRPPHPALADLSKTLKGVPQNAAVVLLSHDPYHWASEVSRNKQVGLTLSGHTHAWQLRFGNISPAALTMPHWAGLYSEGGSRLYVSTGIGGSVPYRLGAWPAYDIITLRKE